MQSSIMNKQKCQKFKKKCLLYIKLDLQRESVFFASFILLIHHISAKVRNLARIVKRFYIVLERSVKSNNNTEGNVINQLHKNIISVWYGKEASTEKLGFENKRYYILALISLQICRGFEQSVLLRNFTIRQFCPTK